MDTNPTVLALLGLLMAVWTALAAWLVIRASQKASRAEAARRHAKRLGRMVDESPAVPMLVRADGRIEGPEKLAGWLGLTELPEYLSDLGGRDSGGFSEPQIADLQESVRRTQKTAAPFNLVLSPRGTDRSLALRGVLADPQVSPGGAALVWIFDFSESEGELTRLRAETDRARGDFAALVGLIEASPMPMWFRERDGRLRLVNRAYVDAVAAETAETVVEKQIELIEKVDGLAAAQVAEQAGQQRMPVERIVNATIDGTRRSLRVSDLPLGDEGIAGYAVDIEELEQHRRDFRAFRDAQRSMLDQLSIGVGQFDSEKGLIFANQPFRRIFAISPGTVTTKIGFERLLTDTRERGRTPEVRDFPAWRAEHADWFNMSETQEENWPLSDGTHLRIVAQPMPDGGLVLIAEDRTEQLALSATRDTLLRTRTATFDSLFEALAVFAPDGHLQLWNRSFAGTWGLETEMLDTHPAVPELVEAIAPNLARPRQAKGIGDLIRAATLDRKEKAGRVALADGRTLEIAGVPLPDGNGLLTVLDITDSQRAEDALRERAEALEEADAVKTRFLANMSYEFRTPLTSIGGFAELLESGAAGELSEQGEEYVRAIIDSVARLTEQVENVLDLSQGEAGLLPVSTEQFELVPFVTTTVREREKAILDAGLTLDMRGEDLGTIEADQRQLGRALGHLLDNAIAATNAGGKVLVDVSRVAGTAYIVVSDNGRGMTKSELARALDGMTSAADGSVEKRQGLGLPLARQLIEAQGGKLEVMSHKGAGTTAKITLP